MRSDDEQLDLESRLLLYVAGELPAEERVALQSRLAREPELVAQLERLREAHDACAEAIGADDAGTRLPVDEGVAVRRVSRTMRQWQIDRMRRPVVEERRRRGMPWWSYPAGVAAALIVAFLTWSMRQEIRPVAPERPIVQGDEEEMMVDWLAGSLGATADAGDEAQLWLPAELPGMDENGTLLPVSPEETIQ